MSFLPMCQRRYKGTGVFLFTDVGTLHTHGDPLTLPWSSTAGIVRIDQRPRAQQTVQE
jgi:hypothetical protein